MIRQHRQETGNMFVISVLTIFCLVIPLLLVFGDLGWYMVDRQRVQNAVEAAGLLAANDLSRIIINDPKFGYVSLSNYPPIGEATRAPDGEPLPVIGINTLVGTIRQNSIVARALRNPTMSVLADDDQSYLETTISDLNTALDASVSGGYGGDYRDIHGESVTPLEDVTGFLNANLPENMQLEEVRITNGWLSEGATTTISVPQPQSLALIYDGDYENGNYKPFVDVPVGSRSFSFAGLGSSSSIVSAAGFQEADTEHICSIIKIECTMVRKTRRLMPSWFNVSPKLHFVVCCQPFTQPDVATRGAMTVRFSGAPVNGLQSWSECLTSANFRDNNVSTYDIHGGDYPVDAEAHMRQSQPRLQPGTAEQFAENLYYWLRNGHLRPRVDEVLNMVSEPFRGSSNVVYVYQFADNGTITRDVLSRDSFPTAVVSDAQFSAVVDTSIQGGITPVVLFRDNVKNLGTKNGGKHCGQPLAGYPLQLRELQEFGSDKELARKYGRRRLYRCGLALDIEIGGTRESTANLDVESMRSRLQSRKI